MTSTKTFPVRFEQPAAGTRTDAVARDVSLGGMFIVTSAPADEGTLLVVETDLEGIKVSVDARVLRRDADGMAVVLIDLPEDVAATLSAAVTPTSARTILGVGSANIKATTPGIAVPPSSPRVPIAVPNIQTTTPGIAAPVLPKKAAAPREERKEPKEREERVERDEPEERESSAPPPPAKRRSGARWFFFLLILGGAAAAYVYREPLRREIEAARRAIDAPATGGGAH